MGIDGGGALDGLPGAAGGGGTGGRLEGEGGRWLPVVGGVAPIPAPIRAPIPVGGVAPSDD